MSRQVLTLGVNYLGEGRCAIRVWSPFAEKVEVCFSSPVKRVALLEREELGYHAALVDDVEPGARYAFRLDGKGEFPDPASKSQPGGVHEPSEVVDPAFEWSDQGWFGLPLKNYVIYEAHVGTISAEGTFDAVIKQLPRLNDLGITALELMPVAQFPGARNWGYDGAYPFAAQNSYGGPAGLKRLVNAAHHAGIAVILDVVYNHLGPEGNYLGAYAPYFTDRYKTPWGDALNFDGPHSDEVRRYFIENALYWQTECHIDALRLDAVHAICDFSATPFLKELGVACERQAEQLNRRFHLIAETDMNDARVVASRELGGLGLQGQWCDDFHHSLHVTLTGEETGYYADFAGARSLEKALASGYVYQGERSPYRKHRHGSAPRGIRPEQLVVCSQNHDQVGNRMLGDRLTQLVSFKSLKVAAAATILSPYTPMLFMGEEYGEKAPFLYFTSHSDEGLIEAVREGRRREFAAFRWEGEPPDPHLEETFQKSRLNLPEAEREEGKALVAFYRELIRWRRERGILTSLEKEGISVKSDDRRRCVWVKCETPVGNCLWAMAFGAGETKAEVRVSAGRWTKVIDSEDIRWGGGGGVAEESVETDGWMTIHMAGESVVLYEQTR